jgi:hypothetical protein
MTPIALVMRAALRRFIGLTLVAVGLLAAVGSAAAAPGGPVITFFGAVSPQFVPLSCGSSTPEGVPICQLASASNFFFVVEGRPGPSLSPVGTVTFDPSGLPDLQIQVDRALGNGSPAVCDNEEPTRGGVAPLSPPDLEFSNPGPVNDLACRFAAEICTLDPFGDPRFLVPTSTVQFCVNIDPVLAFANGDTRISVRLRDAADQLTEVRQLVLRGGGAVLTPTRTIGSIATPTAPPPLIELDDLIAAIFSPAPATEADVNGDGVVRASDIPALFLEM